MKTYIIITTDGQKFEVTGDRIAYRLNVSSGNTSIFIMKRLETVAIIPESGCVILKEK
jgi:hypothetical protein